MARQKHQPLSVQRLLQQQADPKLSRQLNHQHQWQQISQQVLGPLNLEQCRITAMKNGTVFIDCPSAVWMQRLKQLRPALLTACRKALPATISIDFSVNPKLSSKPITTNVASPVVSSVTASTSSREIPEEVKKLRESLKQKAPHGE
ncbi:DUF721 domain-containing protein [Alginatibacterium sediminis]|uniref:DUF721 domain-containing protein n=1 Tax=Alginatibacterium sediminis TaxID=2164068 RepID=A0A420E969_9ALTE|nr:DciA family protein [Alginatibacterium sediminis]RKF15878.1 DUF721 domain-containing protein [Alginatibacterium sediminis]